VTNDHLLATDKLVKEYRHRRVVNGVSITVAPAEIVGLLGPNGAGKTTTVRMLTSLITPTRGRAVVNGFVTGRQDDQIRRTVGVLTETPGLYDNLSAEYNLRIFANLYEVKDVQGQVEKYLRMLGLWDRRFEPTATFSKGMKQKLAIARALLHEPPILFLDEPTAALDPESAHLVRDFIAELRREGRTIFLCTHNLDEADRLCDRIGVFKTRLLVVDSPEVLRRQIFGRKVVFHLRGLEPGLVDLVLKLPYVNEAEAIDERLVVSLDEPEAHNPEIVRTLVAAGAEIQFVGELRHSLEDVYLRLVKDK
jgi:ABC-2 type transport system ATP-binding protein